MMGVQDVIIEQFLYKNSYGYSVSSYIFVKHNLPTGIS